MKRALLIMTILLSALMIGSIAFAHMDGYGNRRGYGHMGRGVYGLKRGFGMMHDGGHWQMFPSGIRGAQFCLAYGDELELSEKQIEELKELEDEYNKAYIGKKANMEELWLEFDKMLDESRINLSKVKSLNSKIAEHQAELRYMHIEEGVKAEAILSEEQLDKLESPIREFRGRGEGGRYCPFF
jgi:hypothetical protein